ncbi:Oidioi.mRNA.OKI2018_I69.chr2.g4112.t1.cds [Oikopleura dioica]|uniref:Oidioi.mRNA.OKI2018_I69.chr2.g4112.t1.cds n=1 Tax=Oikopleura dioica TaxID=34765 RepID=A0ABN7T5E0_OIKDI|nr:Oidioi.mRNA.OKI2018_I69.chr2.g4112.t1.cds [Oikopleura dioica]
MALPVFDNFARESFFHQLPKLNETCTDLDLGEICSTSCGNDLLACLGNCQNGDALCENSCVREGFDCIDGCPCHIDCPAGCQDCPADICNICAFPEENEEHIKCLADLEQELMECIGNCGGNSSCLTLCTVEYSQNILDCPCEENCPNGCPCPHYECEDPEAEELNSVLIMHGESGRDPALANFQSFTQDLKVSWYHNGPDRLEFSAKEGCSVLYKGRNYLFGGWYVNFEGGKEHGPHVLDGCDIKKAEGVSFEFDCFEGSVGQTYWKVDDEPQPFIMVYDGYKNAYRYDGSEILEVLPETTRSHLYIGGHIPLYQNPDHPGDLFSILLGGYDSKFGIYRNSVEWLSPASGWIEDESLTFPEEDNTGKGLSAYCAVSGEFGLVIIPGRTSSNRKIWRLHKNQWENIGLVPWTSFRGYARAVLFPNNEIMVLGGYSGDWMFTKFIFNEDFTSIEGEDLEHLPSLKNWDDPYAMLVPDNYCVIN